MLCDTTQFTTRDNYTRHTILTEQTPHISCFGMPVCNLASQQHHVHAPVCQFEFGNCSFEESSVQIPYLLITGRVLLLYTYTGVYMQRSKWYPNILCKLQQRKRNLYEIIQLFLYSTV